MTRHSPASRLVRIGCAGWAGWDSSRTQLTKYKSLISSSPIVTALACAGGFLLFFPWYLGVKYKIEHGLALPVEPTARQTSLSRIYVVVMCIIVVFAAGPMVISGFLKQKITQTKQEIDSMMREHEKGKP